MISSVIQKFASDSGCDAVVHSGLQKWQYGFHTTRKYVLPDQVMTSPIAFGARG